MRLLAGLVSVAGDDTTSGVPGLICSLATSCYSARIQASRCAISCPASMCLALAISLAEAGCSARNDAWPAWPAPRGVRPDSSARRSARSPGLAAVASAASLSLSRWAVVTAACCRSRAHAACSWRPPARRACSCSVRSCSIPGVIVRVRRFLAMG